MDRYVFAVADEPYCCWEYDLAERNQRFLATLDATYFHYVADRHFEEVEGENRQRAAVALRAAYHHGLETLFSLLGALTQAPDAVPAWLPLTRIGATAAGQDGSPHRACAIRCAASCASSGTTWVLVHRRAGLQVDVLPQQAKGLALPQPGG